MQEPEKPAGAAGAHDEERERAGPGGRWRRRSARGRAVIAATAVAVLALGGTVAYAAANGSDGGSPSASPSASASDGPGGRHDRGGPWSGLGGDAVHGEATVKDRDTGDWVVRVWQRGTVEKVNDDHVTVKSEDGVSWTWTVGSGTSVFSDGTSGSGPGALKKGETVFVAGSRSGDTNTAERVVSGTFGDHDPGDRHDGFPGHGPWDRGDDRSADPTDNGTAS
ncbi:hypothetical protein [Streptomyces sp. yr375]|uniref:hypothetical protein n=1 Tax=Streptomyces sp. yr375 TaxID=1761906 RepID=UPI00116036AA|nr:hypothetical protein [Streptomyces sp. yr375]